MKRFALLALVAVFVLGTFGTAMAETETTFSGSYQATFQWYKSAHSILQQDNGDDTFHVQQRMRVFMNFATSETNKAIVGLEMDGDWGSTSGETTDASSWQLNGDSAAAVELKRGLLQFNVPNTALTVVAGLQGVSLPDALGNNQVYNNDAAGLTMVYPIADNLTATAAWIRAADTNRTSNQAGSGHGDEADALAVILNITPVEGFNIQPYYAHLWAGETYAGTTKDETAWWIGAAMTLSMFDPITIAADFDLGSYDGATDERDTGGWATDVLITYAMDMVTPGIVFHYGTGHDGDTTDGNEMLPTIAVDSTYAVTNFGTGGGRGRSVDGLFHGVTNQASANGIAGANGAGVWALGGVLNGISLVDSLTTDIAVVYFEGTNDKDSIGNVGATLFTEKDSAWEINVNNTYAMYEELSVLVDFGYVTVDWDESLAAGRNTYDQDAYKFMIGLEYAF